MTGLSRFADPQRAFASWGLVGLAAACTLGLALTRLAGLSASIIGLLTLVAVATFGVLVQASYRPDSGTRLVYYHHELAILSVCAVALAGMRHPVLPYLDVVALSIGAFLFFGRWGCLVAGCCHGRPAPWGRRYDQRYAPIGFPAHLIGVRLLPVQAIEAAGVLVVVAYGCLLARTDAAGAALAWYVTGYGALRYVLEDLRGDAGRSAWLGHTQAQWISMGLCAAVVTAGLLGLLPSQPLHAVVLVAMVLDLAVRAGVRSWRQTAGTLLDPLHVAEVAAVLEALRDPTVPVRATSRGLRLSADRNPPIRHYTLSATVGTLEHRRAAAVGSLVGHLHGTSTTLLPGHHDGLFHIVLTEPTSAAPSNPAAFDEVTRPLRPEHHDAPA